MPEKIISKTVKKQGRKLVQEFGMGRWYNKCQKWNDYGKMLHMALLKALRLSQGARANWHDHVKAYFLPYFVLVPKL